MRSGPARHHPLRFRPALITPVDVIRPDRTVQLRRAVVCPGIGRPFCFQVPDSCTGLLYRTPVSDSCIGLLYRTPVSDSCIGLLYRTPVRSSDPLVFCAATQRCSASLRAVIIRRSSEIQGPRRSFGGDGPQSGKAPDGEDVNQQCSHGDPAARLPRSGCRGFIHAPSHRSHRLAGRVPAGRRPAGRRPAGRRSVPQESWWPPHRCCRGNRARRLDRGHPSAASGLPG